MSSSDLVSGFLGSLWSTLGLMIAIPIIAVYLAISGIYHAVIGNGEQYIKTYNARTITEEEYPARSLIKFNNFLARTAIIILPAEQYAGSLNSNNIYGTLSDDDDNALINNTISYTNEDLEKAVNRKYTIIPPSGAKASLTMNFLYPYVGNKNSNYENNMRRQSIDVQKRNISFDMSFENYKWIITGSKIDVPVVGLKYYDAKATMNMILPVFPVSTFEETYKLLLPVETYPLSFVVESITVINPETVVSSGERKFCIEMSSKSKSIHYGHLWVVKIIFKYNGDMDFGTWKCETGVIYQIDENGNIPNTNFNPVYLKENDVVNKLLVPPRPYMIYSRSL